MAMNDFAQTPRPGMGGKRQLLFSLSLVACIALALVVSGCAALPDIAKHVKEFTEGEERSNDQVLVDKAYEAMHDGNYAYAEVYLDAAMQVNPSNSFALLNMGIVYEHTAREEEARALYANLIRLAPTNKVMRADDDSWIGKTVTQLAEERLAGLDRAVLARAVRGTEAQENTPTVDPDVNLESDWRSRVDERIALLEELKIQKFISEDEFIARVGGAWVLARMMPTPDTGGVVQRLTSLESYQRRGLIEADVYARERSVILDSVAPIRGIPVEGQTAAKEEAAAKAAAMASADEKAMPEAERRAAGKARVHLASYRSEKAARKGWSTIKEQFKDLLGALSGNVRKVDLGPEKGIYYRVTAGPLEDSAAKALCKKMHTRKHFCQVGA